MLYPDAVLAPHLALLAITHASSRPGMCQALPRGRSGGSGVLWLVPYTIMLGLDEAGP